MPVISVPSGLREKDIGRFSTAADAHGELVSAPPATTSGPVPSTTADGRPSSITELYCYLLVGGLSYDLHESFCRLTFELDPLTKKRMHIRVIGDPAQSGPLYLAQLSKESRQRLEQDHALYVKDVLQEGLAEHHVLGQNRTLLDMLGLETDALPLLTFHAPGNPKPIATWLIEPEWHRSEEARAVFGTELVRWFSGGALLEKLEAATTSEDLAQFLEGEFINLAQRIDAGLGARRATTRGARFPIRRGTNWSSVTIQRLDVDRISVRVGAVSRVQNFTQMGMVDDRGAGPDKQWRLLQAILEGHGTLGWTDSAAAPENQKRKERLADALKRFFGIDSDPFELIDDAADGRPRKAWKARFQVPPPA